MSKIPDHAQCVFKGVIFDVYQWEQLLFDGTTVTFEALKRPNTVVVIPVLADGRIAYAMQEQPGRPATLSLFGGRAEEGEDPLETAKRELLEETGFVSEDWQSLREVVFPGKIDWTIYYYAARNCQKVAEQNLDAGEKIEIFTTTLDHFISEIIPAAGFREYELQREILSAFSNDAADKMKRDILSK